MARHGRGPGAIFKGALDIQLGQEMIKLFGAAAPWVFMFLVAPVLSLVFYLLWRHSGWTIVPVFAIAAALLSFWNLKVTHVKRWPGKFLALANINFWIFWLAAASHFGMLTRPTFDIYIVGGLLLGAMATMRILRGGDEDSGMINWKNVDEKAGFNGKTRWSQLPGIGKNIIRGKIKLKEGMTAQQLMRSEDTLKSIMGLPKNGLRFVENMDDASQVEIRIVTEDLLKHDIPWERSPYAGRSIADGPIRIGTYEDGEPAYIHLYTKGGARHILVSGMNGSGKTVGMRIIMLDAAERVDCRVIGLDVAKTEQTFGPMKSALDILIDNIADGTIFMTKLKAVIKERASHLGKNGYASWQPGCGLDFLVIAVDEGASFVNESDDFTRVVETARSAGISLVMAIQRASHTNMSTDARAQFGSTLCFGVRDDQDARFVLSDETLEAGAHPEMWKADKQGYAYLEASGVPVERHATPLKTMYLDVADVPEASKYIADRDVDPFTMKAFGEKYYRMEKYGTESGASQTNDETDEDVSQQHINAVRKLVRLEDGDDFQEEEVTALDERMIYESEDEGPALVFDTEPKKKMSPDDAREAFDMFLLKMYDEGKRTFRVKDLYPVLEETGRVRGWLHHQLDVRKEKGIVVHDSETGDYTIVGGVASVAE